MKAGGTVSVLAARPPIVELQSRGIDPEPVLAGANLSRAALASIDNRLPYDGVHRLWEAAAVAANDRSLGAHVAEALPFGAFDLFDYILATATTLGEGLARLVHYVRLIFDLSNLHLITEPRHVRLVDRVMSPAPQFDEFSFTLLLVRSRQATGTGWRPESMAFQHERPGGAHELARIFACPVTFGAARTEMLFAPSVLQLPLKRTDSRLLAILTRYADSLLTSMPRRGDLVAAAVSEIARQMAKSLPSLSSTADAVHLSERTLQRRLAEHGLDHSTLLDEVRRGLALKYIGDAGLSIHEIAFILHFSDSAAFYRAFKRWTGEAPARYRGTIFGRTE